MIIDSQVHAYEANTSQRPWRNDPDWPPHVTGAEMLAAMDDVGVDGAILVSPFILYGYDAGYAVEIGAEFPDRFALVKMIDSADPAVEDDIALWKETPGTVGIRVRIDDRVSTRPDDPGVAAAMRAAARHDLAVNVLCGGRVDDAIALVDRHPETRFVIDHLGIDQHFPVSATPWRQLDGVLELGRRVNAMIKVSGACVLSKHPFPYPDIWGPLGRVFDAWGVERCLWGTDWTRTAKNVSYAQATIPFLLTDRLTEDERAKLMGGACAAAYGWAPSPASSERARSR
ncbi:amidohydrolase family protein [Microbacterium aoyamense]|uniref:Amidohydrolase family protein n=1 Tax=Microbacterium aoyamense TaxID=344166 RepID=A0ABP5AQ24_9MICO|nr:amidohydrolase family protein [Microbacterium aoyamense]